MAVSYPVESWKSTGELERMRVEIVDSATSNRKNADGKLRERVSTGSGHTNGSALRERVCKERLKKALRRIEVRTC